MIATPNLDRARDLLAELPPFEARTAGGDGETLHAYWTESVEGLAKWAGHAHPWAELYSHLSKHMEPKKAKNTTSKWYYDTLGRWPTPAETGSKSKPKRKGRRS